MAYIRFSEILFDSDQERNVCEALYKSIYEAENDLIAAEDLLERLHSIVGEKEMIMIGMPSIMILSKVLMGLKIAFWYYARVPAAYVLDDVTDLDAIDIFNP